MAITGSTLVADALQACGAYGQGETPSAADSALAFRRLNRMLDSWGNLRSRIYEIFDESLTLVNGTQEYSSATLLVAGRPIDVDSIRVSYSSTEYPVELIDNQRWNDINYKPATGVPDRCYIQWGQPVATLKFYPIPFASMTAYISCFRRLANVSAAVAAATSIVLPLGYDAALVDNLALDLCSSFGIEPKLSLVRSARQTLAAIEGKNHVSHVMESHLSPGSRKGSIFTDGF